MYTGAPSHPTLESLKLSTIPPFYDLLCQGGGDIRGELQSGLFATYCSWPYQIPIAGIARRLGDIVPHQNAEHFRHGTQTVLGILCAKRIGLEGNKRGIPYSNLIANLFQYEMGGDEMAQYRRLLLRVKQNLSHHTRE